MGRTYDNWERLVEVVMRREQLRNLSLTDSRSPSTRSLDSDYSFSSSSWHDDNLSSSRATPSPLHPNAVKLKLANSANAKMTTKSRNVMWKGLSIFGGFSSKKDSDKWASDRKTLHGLEKQIYNEASPMAKEAKMRVEIASSTSRSQLDSAKLKLAKTVNTGKQIGNEKVHTKRINANAMLKGLSIFGGLSSKKGCAREERELKWAKAQKYEKVTPKAEEAKRRAEIARLQELHTLKGQINSFVKATGLHIDSINHYYSWSSGNYYV
ncbi:hypothetical protein PHJA_000250200 [Phtheirospermum japonicum]|uniref:Uncharacterized protein n=1 Tax=Phtheirospermum japonicum TaxID=374723 RepID=A0A830B726_9LAMI|nr:hypothetical protein PHJA_000250200 [Phtheirospermum japonicum]